MDILRRRKQTAPLAVEDMLAEVMDNEAEQAFWTAIDQADLQQAMQALSSSERKLIQLYFASGLTSAELAAIFGITEAATKKRRQRAIAKLREAYERRAYYVDI